MVNLRGESEHERNLETSNLIPIEMNEFCLQNFAKQQNMRRTFRVKDIKNVSMSNNSRVAWVAKVRNTIDYDTVH